MAAHADLRALIHPPTEGLCPALALALSPAWRASAARPTWAHANMRPFGHWPGQRWRRGLSPRCAGTSTVASAHAPACARTTRGWRPCWRPPLGTGRGATTTTAPARWQCPPGAAGARGCVPSLRGHGLCRQAAHNPSPLRRMPSHLNPAPSLPPPPHCLPDLTPAATAGCRRPARLSSELADGTPAPTADSQGAGVAWRAARVSPKWRAATQCVSIRHQSFGGRLGLGGAADGTLRHHH